MVSDVNLHPYITGGGTLDSDAGAPLGLESTSEEESQQEGAGVMGGALEVDPMQCAMELSIARLSLTCSLLESCHAVTLEALLPNGSATEDDNDAPAAVPAAVPAAGTSLQHLDIEENAAVAGGGGAARATAPPAPGGDSPTVKPADGWMSSGDRTMVVGVEAQARTRLESTTRFQSLIVKKGYNRLKRI